MRVILYMACSLNGMIARPNDDTDFLAHDNWTSFVELAQQTGALIWGRKTHELVRGYGPQYIQDLEGTGRVVLSRSAELKLEPGWQVAGGPEEALALLEQTGAPATLLVGGAAVNSAFAQRGLIDAVVLNIESVLVGEGIPLLAPIAVDLRLRLEELRHVTDEIVQLHYSVVKEHAVAGRQA